MRKQIVVARYDEDLAWLSDRLDDVDALVYNKGVCPIGKGYWHPFAESVQLPNVGREGHTYLTHIVNNYDRLADVTLFTQGDPHAHLLKSFDLYSLFDGGPGITGYRLATGLREWDEYGRLRHRGKWLDQLDKGDMRPATNGLLDWFRWHAGVDPEVLGCLAYFPGAVFAATRETIYARPKSFYEDVLKSIPKHSNPEESYYLERSWVYLLGRDGVNYSTFTGNGRGLAAPSDNPSPCLLQS